MSLTPRLPLALKQLTDAPVKTAAAAAGICFSTVLVFFQLGLLNAIYQSQSRPYSLLDGEIVLVSDRFSRLSQSPEIALSDVMRAQGVEGVAHVSPLSIQLGILLILPQGFTTNAQIYSIDPSNSALSIEKTKLNISSLTLYERASIDNMSRPSYVSNVQKKLKSNSDYRTNLGDKRLIINSISSIGSTFAADLSLVMSQDNLMHYFPGRSYSKTNLGIVKLKPGYSIQKVLDTLNSKLYPVGYNIMAMSIPEISDKEMKFWRENTSLTFIFGIGVIVGFVVSGIILYQILYSDVISHLPEYATLLALGYPNIYVIKVVFVQAFLLTAISFPFSFAISLGLYGLMASATNLVIYMTLERCISVLFLSLLTSSFSCYLATNQLRKVDPSSLY
ncbi:FtsX-like permease family protein [Synechococcus sp. UW140]|uniref:FtsX-like permease family protein n=1 Tax=Synechococcus sp. UW140 TaxID=368503 RepID=UPI0025F49ED4|nr:FtsX-like permease family protein [Synechococcus sp. UW140]